MKLKQSQMRTGRIKGIIVMHSRNLLIKGSINSKLVLENNNSLAFDWLRYTNTYYSKIIPNSSKFNLGLSHYHIETLSNGYPNVISNLRESETSPWLETISPLLDDYILITLQGDASKFIFSDETLKALGRVLKDITFRYSHLTNQSIHLIDEVFNSGLFDEDLKKVKDKYGIEIVKSKFLIKNEIRLYI